MDALNSAVPVEPGSADGFSRVGDALPVHSVASAEFDHRRALEIGAAGEHLVCADLLLAGGRAFQGGQGLPYDVVAEFGGRLIRVAVKSTTRPRQRPGRAGSSLAYMFSITRSMRSSTGKTTARAYSVDDVDDVALVALDIRQIAYVAMSECPTGLHFRSESSPPRTTKYGPRAANLRCFQDFPLHGALKALAERSIEVAS